MNEAKIRLSPAEMELVQNADLILTKNAILKKVSGLLGTLQEKQQAYTALHSAGLPGKVSGSSPKISRGENYLGLPYLLLDYPRVFEHENLPERQAGIFAVRTLFWWGNFFSVTLHLSGSYKKEAEEKLMGSYESMKEKGYFYCISEEQWQHHFKESNYALLRGGSRNDFEKSIREKTFIKLANKIPLQQWEEAPEILEEFFKDLVNMMAGEPTIGT